MYVLETSFIFTVQNDDNVEKKLDIVVRGHFSKREEDLDYNFTIQDSSKNEDLKPFIEFYCSELFSEIEDEVQSKVEKKITESVNEWIEADMYY